MLGRIGDDHLPPGHAQPHQHIHLPQTVGGDGLHREEIHGPECLRMPFDEIVPGVGRAVGAGLDAFLFQDVPDGLATDLFNAELPQLADDAGVPEPGCLGDLDDQFPDLFGLALATFGRA